MDFFPNRRQYPARSILAGVTAIFLTAGYKLLPPLIRQHTLFDSMSELHTRRYAPFSEEYDFVIVGAGTSGSLVANRLSKYFRTLLLEAGGTPFPLQNIPAFAPLMLGQRELDWRFFTVPQKNSCLSHINNSNYWPRGRGLGGTSNLNFLAWIRGHPLDYDQWAEITGDKRWSYEELLPYFKQTENYLGEGNSSFHGYNGEMTISSVPFKPLVKYFVTAAVELGYPIKDLNAPFDEAFNEHSFNNAHGQRLSSYEAFLRPIERNRGHKLTIRKFAYATKFLIDQELKAYGVEYVQGGRVYHALAKREVISSSGTINSPKLLMLSGIGDFNHLERVGIVPKVVNLPGVGRNLQDHVSAMVGPFTINKRLTFLPSRDSRPSNLLDYFARGKGPLVQSGSMASGFISTNKSAFGRVWPDIQLLLIGIPQDDEGLRTLSRTFNLHWQVAEQYYGPVLNRDSFSIMTSVARPQSRGEILLSSKDPFAPPLIDPKYFHDESDMKVLLRGISKALELVEGTQIFSSIGAKLLKNPFPSCRHLKYRSDEYWTCFAQQYTVSVYHPSGTCAMGAVVDSSLKVKGVKNLRVIDASIMPTLVNSNINAACTVIAERGASMILEEHLKHTSPTIK